MPASPLDWPLLLATAMKIVFAYLLALPSGWVSEREGHTVGVRTLPIVAMASCGFILITQGQPGPDALTATSRVLQGLIAGIGFVGGGAILKEGFNVQGTATAASILNTGAIGAGVAMHRYEVAIVLAALNLFTMKALVPLKRRLDGISTAK